MSRTVIVGGGPAGAAAACLLARAGEEALLLERETGPHDKVCGDFLSIEAQRSIAALGLDLARFAPHPIERLRLFHGRRVAEAHLPFTALGLSRRVLDAALLDHAEASGAVVRRGTRALGMRTGPDGPLTETSEGPVRADALFLATGKHELRGAARPAAASGLVGFKMYWRLAPDQEAALHGCVELFPFDGGYAGLLLVEGGAANLSLVVSGARLTACGRTWDGLLDWLRRISPHLRGRLRDAAPRLPRPLAIGRLPYGYLHRPEPADPGAVFRLGDQGAVIPSLTGDGLAVALHSAEIAAAFRARGATAAAFHACQRRAMRGQMARAALLHRAFGQPALHAPLFAACRWLPGLMRLGASLTRLSDHTAGGWSMSGACGSSSVSMS